MAPDREIPSPSRATLGPNLTVELRDEALRELWSRRAIDDLTTVYAMAVDDHDIETVLGCFATDGVFIRRSYAVTGHDELRTFYGNSMDRYDLTLHTPTPPVVVVEGETAYGSQRGHAELAYQGRLMVAAYRYDDRYRVEDGRWVFARRELGFAYVAPLDTLHRAFVADGRIQWPDAAPEPADLPRHSRPG